MKFIRPIALIFFLCMGVSLTACDVLLEEFPATSEETTSAETLSETPTEASTEISTETPTEPVTEQSAEISTDEVPTAVPTETFAETITETEPPVLPPSLPTVDDLVAGYTYDWHPDGNTMTFGNDRDDFRIVAVDEISASHLIKYKDIMLEHQDFGEYVLYMPSSGIYDFTELSAETDPAFFAAGNTFVLTFHTLTYNTTMKLEVVVFTESGRRIVEELYPARGTTPTTINYTVQDGDVGIGLHWLTGSEPMYIGNLHVTMIPA